MNEEILKRLDLLADKLGVTSGHLWEVLVGQSYIDGYIGLTISCAIILIFTCSYIKRKSMSDYLDGVDEGGLSVVLITVLLLLALAGALSEIKHLVNPEYYAMKDVLRVIR